VWLKCQTWLPSMRSWVQNLNFNFYAVSTACTQPRRTGQVSALTQNRVLDGALRVVQVNQELPV
jgi:hypothetical protein